MLWIHHDHDIYNNAGELSATLDFIQELRASWQESHLRVPSIWFNFVGDYQFPVFFHAEIFYQDKSSEVTLESLNLILLNTLLAPVRDRLLPIEVTPDSHPELADEEIEAYGREDAHVVYGILDSFPVPGLPDRSLVDRIGTMFVHPGLHSCWLKMYVLLASLYT